MPLLRVGTHDIGDYGPQWLEQTILKAAVDAGHEKWWFAHDLTRSVFIYLKERFQKNIITLSELRDKVGAVLVSIGFEDIASKLAINPPPWRLSLADTARQAGNGFELAFYRILDQKIDECAQLGVTELKLSGLRSA
ncbi:MAG: hypothetical protein AAF514_08780, partial [Verrucomicrobiota bacterium]